MNRESATLLVAMAVLACAPQSPRSNAQAPLPLPEMFVVCGEYVMARGWLALGPDDTYAAYVMTDIGGGPSEGYYSVRADTLVLLEDSATPGIAVSPVARYLLGTEKNRVVLIPPSDGLQAGRPWMIQGDTTESVRCRDDR